MTDFIRTLLLLIETQPSLFWVLFLITEAPALILGYLFWAERKTNQTLHAERIEDYKTHLGNSVEALRSNSRIAEAHTDGFEGFKQLLYARGSRHREDG